jgi:hypothetical protein
MHYVRYVHLTKAKQNHKKKNPTSLQRGCYIRTITASVHLQKKKKKLFVSLKGFDPKTN